MAARTGALAHLVWGSGLVVTGARTALVPVARGSDKKESRAVRHAEWAWLPARKLMAEIQRRKRYRDDALWQTDEDWSYDAYPYDVVPNEAPPVYRRIREENGVETVRTVRDDRVMSSPTGADMDEEVDENDEDSDEDGATGKTRKEERGEEKDGERREPFRSLDPQGEKGPLCPSARVTQGEGTSRSAKVSRAYSPDDMALSERRAGKSIPLAAYGDVPSGPSEANKGALATVRPGSADKAERIPLGTPGARPIIRPLRTAPTPPRWRRRG